MFDCARDWAEQLTFIKSDRALFGKIAAQSAACLHPRCRVNDAKQTANLFPICLVAFPSTVENALRFARLLVAHHELFSDFKIPLHVAPLTLY